MAAFTPPSLALLLGLLLFCTGASAQYATARALCNGNAQEAANLLGSVNSQAAARAAAFASSSAGLTFPAMPMLPGLKAAPPAKNLADGLVLLGSTDEKQRLNAFCSLMALEERSLCTSNSFSSGFAREICPQCSSANVKTRGRSTIESPEPINKSLPCDQVQDTGSMCQFFAG
ncbi:hypothetical protein N2152v2_004494 [Parachlorella kessleri]